jgi:hypothetical protein
MAKATLASIRSQSDKLHRRWQREFAGKPRHSRELSELEKIVQNTAVLAKKAKGIPGDKGDELERVVTERLKLYREERDAIADAQFDRPEVAEIHVQGQRVDRAMSIWRRHYAGRDRRTRDLPRLDVVIRTLQEGLPRLEALAEHPEVKKESLDSLRTQLEVLKDERSEIVKLRKNAEPAVRVASLLAEAQSALEQYRVHFAGQPRATCSPARLERMIAMLDRVTRALGEADVAGANEEADQARKDNLALMTGHLDAWRAELPELERALREVSTRDRSNQLGMVANQLFQIYQREFAGQARATRNLQLLSDLCDRLGELSELMTEHDTATEEPLNRKNMPTVDERLRRYESEWMEIAKAKAPQAGATASAGPNRPAAPQITIADDE